MSLRVIQFSDIHLSGEYPLFLHNWAVLTRLAATLSPDLVIVSGDLALAEPDRTQDLYFARAELDALAEQLAVPVLALPGNHDLGEGATDDPARSGEQKPVTSARVARYRAIIGPDYWLHRAGAWHVLGLDAQLFGTGLPEEEAQREFIETALARAGGPQLMVVTHKPLHAPEQGATQWGRSIPEAESAWLRQRLRAAGVRHVFSGHMHRYKQYHSDGLQHVWAPSTAFISTHPSHDVRAGEARVGMLCHDIGTSEISTGLIDDPRLITSDIRLWALPAGNALWSIVTEPSPIRPHDQGLRANFRGH